jgi:transcriptional regulator with XRE-family HTH domain
MDFGKAIKILRATANLEQRELADIADVDASLISMIEKGKRNPSLATIERITKELGVPQHLFTLLAAEPKDLRTAGPEEVQRAAESLARMLLSNAFKRKPRKRRRRSRDTT